MIPNLPALLEALSKNADASELVGVYLEAGVSETAQEAMRSIASKWQSEAEEEIRGAAPPMA